MPTTAVVLAPKKTSFEPCLPARSFPAAAAQITIRIATTADLAELARLNAQFNDVDTTAEQIAERLADPQCVEIPIVAEVDQHIAGFAGLRVVPQIFYAGAHAELTELFVEEGYRRRGVGQALIRFAEHLAASKGAEELVIHTGEDNHAAQTFYSTMGYAPWEIVMGKTLSRPDHHLIERTINDGET